MPGQIDAQLAKLNITLPKPGGVAGNYVPYQQIGDLIFISGQVTVGPDGLEYCGKLGQDYSVEEGQAAARLCAINIVAQLKAACGGDLDRVVKCAKITGFVNATADFEQHPSVINGASDLFVEVFGDKGKHARAAVGVGSLPFNVAVEVEAIFQIG